MIAVVDKDACIKCGACVDACPLGLIYCKNDNVASISEGQCLGCGACADVCLSGAISVE